MPSFKHGKIWLEVEGKRMEEYGLSGEMDIDRRFLKTCFVELIPGARFKICWSYDPRGASVDGCTACYWVDGHFIDGIDSLAIKGQLQDFSEGYPFSADTVAPYQFEDRTLLKGEESPAEAFDSATIRCIITPFKKVRAPYVPYWIPTEGENDEPPRPTNEAAAARQSVGYGEEVESAPFIVPAWNCERLGSPPSLHAVFRYRTRDELVALGLVEDRPTSQETTPQASSPAAASLEKHETLLSEAVSSKRSVGVQTSNDATATEEQLQQALSRLGELEAVITAMGKSASSAYSS